MLRLRNLLLAVWFGAIAFALVPAPRLDPPTSPALFDRRGVLLGAAVAADQQWRFPAGEALPERYVAAVTRFEDRRFWWHPGVDPLAVARALAQNVAAGQVRSGASTLTMQVVRLSRGNPERTLAEKLLEVALALRLESVSSKEEILQTYAANAPFGGNTVGLEAASYRYFGRPPADLSWAEAATLAVLPNAPGLVHPGRSPDALRERRDRLLDALVAQGDLSAEEGALAKAEPLPREPLPVPRLAPHLLARARGHTPSTLDAALQARANEVVARHGRRLAENHIHNVAALIVDVESGEVLAWVGNTPAEGADDPHGRHVDVVTSRRSTGSLLKPWLYLAMIQDGLLLPRQLVPDHPLRVGGFAPENFDRKYDGAVPASEALARSRNVPAVWMLREYGVDRFHAFLSRAGMTTLDRPAQDYGLTLVLGGAEGTLLELVSLYRHLAWTANHPRTPDRGFAPVHWQGSPPEGAPPAVLDPGAAWATLEALHEVARPGELGSWRSFVGSRRVAWKTGTSMGFRDGWAVGVTPEVAIGVWTGNADGEGRPELVGVKTAAPILFDLLELLPAAGWWEEPDEALVEVELCAHSGMLAGADCPRRVRALVPRAERRTGPCGYCRLVPCDAATCTERVDASCAPVEEIEARPWFVLPPTEERYYVHRHPEYRPLPPVRAGCSAGEEPATVMSVVSPREGATIYVPLELSGERGRVVVQAAHRDAGARLFWHLDGRYLGQTRDLHELALAPDAGEHELVLVDADGARISRRFTVLADPRGG